MFGLINWHHRRYCPKGFRPPRIVRRRYEWTYLYAAVEPTTGESFCSYMPGMDGRCLEGFLEHLAEAYADYHLLLVMDNAPSHLSKEIVHPQNISLLNLPAYSPELKPGREMVSGVSACAIQQGVRERAVGSGGAYRCARSLLARSRSLATAHRLLVVGGGC